MFDYISNLVQSNEQITKLKRKSKILHKDLSTLPTPKTLMQCQDIIAKEEGYNHWHHLHQTIKNFYTEICDNKNFFMTTQKINIQQAFYLGKNIFEKYSWINNDSLKTHIIHYGDNKKVNELFISQLKKERKTFIFSDSIDDFDFIKDFKSIDLDKINLFDFSYECLAEILMSEAKKQYHDNILDYKEFFFYMAEILFFERKNNIKFSIHNLLDYLHIDKLSQIILIAPDKFPSTEKYFDSLMKKSRQTNVEFKNIHHQLIDRFSKLLSNIEEKLTQNSCFDLFNHHEEIIHIKVQRNEINQIMLRFFMSKYLFSNPKDSLFILKDIYIAPTLYAQARSFRTIIFSNITNHEIFSNEYNFNSMDINHITKIFSNEKFQHILTQYVKQISIWSKNQSLKLEIPNLSLLNKDKYLFAFNQNIQILNIDQ